MKPYFRRITWLAVSAIALVTTFGCVTQSGHPVPHSSSGAVRSTGAAVEIVCPTSKDVPLARYVGAYLGIENLLTPKDFAQDLYCAEQFKLRQYPNGFVTMFGSSRIKEHNTGPDPELNAANDKLYAQVKQFAHDWTRLYGSRYPILTGAGPGLMEAASWGAIEAGPSVGYTTYYDPAPMPTPTRPYGGNPAAAFWKHQGSDLLTDGLIFSSIAMRETAMIRHSAAVIITPGGTGTEWETFEILETIKSKQLAKVPVYIVGNRAVHWKSFDARVADMVARGTLRDGEATDGVEFLDDPTDVIKTLPMRLGLN